MKNKKNAFTLVELLAVIVILAVILVIAVPKVMSVIEDAKMGTLESTAKMIASQAEKAKVQNTVLGKTDEITCDSIAKINSNDYLYCNVTFNEIGEAKVTIVGSGKFKDKYVCEGTKKEANSVDKQCDGGIPTDILQEIHEFHYYPNMVTAVNDVNNAEIGKNATSTKEDAKAGVYTYNDEHYVVLLKDSIEEERLKLSIDMTINLGGNTLSSKDTVVIDIESGIIVLDGAIEGSKIEKNSSDGSNGRLIQIKGGIFNVNGGTYIFNLNYDSITHAIGMHNSSVSTFNNINLIISSDISYVRGIEICDTCTATIMNSNIMAKSHITSKTNSTHGVFASGITVVKNSKIYGATSAIINKGTLIVEGGIYDGYYDGGLSLTRKSTTTYVRNSVVRKVPILDGYTMSELSRGSGVYIGGNNMSNISAYIDNCDIYGSEKQIVMEGNSNNLYISNSRLHDLNSDNTINIDIGNNTNKLYLGRGINFTKDNTNLPESVIETDEVYINN